MIGRVTAVTANATQRARTASSRPSRLLSARAASANFNVACRASVRSTGPPRESGMLLVSANTLKPFTPDFAPGSCADERVEQHRNPGRQHDTIHHQTKHVRLD